MVFENCSDGVAIFAVIGMIVVYFAVGAFIGWLVSSCLNGGSRDEKESLILLSVVLWPLAIVAGFVYLVAMWLAFPFIAATKEYVDRAEARVNRRVDRECSTCVDADDSLDILDEVAPFKAGDVITGIVPQTDKHGDVMSYKHLYQGCKCRVLTIDSDDSMKVVLIDHKDKAAHAHKFGDTFTVPARNFTKVKKSYKKRKVAKKVAKKRTRR